MGKTSYLVIGLESSCTKFVSKLIAVNSGVIKNFDDWSGFHSVSDGIILVSHRSLPHRDRDNFISLQEIELYDKVVICTRDFNCSLLSKNKDHQEDLKEAYNEHIEGSLMLQMILSSLENKPYIFSYETALIMQNAYLHRFLDEIGLYPSVLPEVKNVNLKYVSPEKLGEVVEYYC